MSNKKGFTLIELLVVISIIALLVGILLPALSSAKKSAESVICKSNIRGIGTAWVMYADSNNEYVLPAWIDYTANYGPGRWAPWYEELLNMELVGARGGKNEEVLHCPSEDTNRIAYYLSEVPLSYAYNPYLGDGTHHSVVAGTVISSGKEVLPKLANIRSTSEVIVAGDGWKWNEVVDPGSTYRSLWQAYFIEGVMDLGDEFGAHRDAMNALWADGHVSLLDDPDYKFTEAW